MSSPHNPKELKVLWSAIADSKTGKSNKEPTAKVMGIQRLRDNIDGPGIRSLVLFNTCPLECDYCLNKIMMQSGIEKEFTPEKLYEALQVDTTYFELSEGGVTFGGGEPALQVDFIEQFADLVIDKWSIILETSLNVPRENIARLSRVVDRWIVDIKDMNPNIYFEYTGHSGNPAYDNLEWLVANGFGERIRVRVPLIPDYNTPEDQTKSIEKLKAMGLEVEPFTYIKTHSKEEVETTCSMPTPPDDTELVGELPEAEEIFSYHKPRKIKPYGRKKEV